MALFSFTGLGSEPRWTCEEMMKLKTFSHLRLSNDGKSLLFVANENGKLKDKDQTLSQIYRVDLEKQNEPKALTTQEEEATFPRWSPDGKWIAFLAKKEGVYDLYLIPSKGGEKRQLTQGKESVQTFRWSPDSRKIAFVKTDLTEEEKLHLSSPEDPFEYQKDKKVNRLWVLDIEAHAEPIALTTDEYHVRGVADFGICSEEYDWSPDNKTLVFAYCTHSGLNHYRTESSLAAIDLPSGAISKLKKHARFEALPLFSPDGNWIAYTSSDDTHVFCLNSCTVLRSTKDQTPRYLPPTYNEGPFIKSASFLGWSKDSKSLLVYEPKGTNHHLCWLSLEASQPKEIPIPAIYIEEPALSTDGSQLVFVSQTPSSPPEVCITPLSSFTPKQLTQLNHYFSKHPQISTETLTWKSPDGLTIEGLLTYPVGYQKGKKYPLLVVIHGGPMAFFYQNYIATPNPYPLAAFAQEGYFILRPNPRGSCGYGKSFRTANYFDWGGKDFEDIEAGVDAVISRGMIDSNKMGVMGWSYGGYMTARVVTQTSRYKAASLGAGTYNLLSMAGTTDLHDFLLDYMGPFWERHELYKERSPLFQASQITTPCLIQHGIDDARVCISQAYELYHALKALGKNPLLMVYPKMQHRFHDPKMLHAAMKCNLDWFQKHLN